MITKDCMAMHLLVYNGLVLQYLITILSNIMAQLNYFPCRSTYIEQTSTHIYTHTDIQHTHNTYTYTHTYTHITHMHIHIYIHTCTYIHLTHTTHIHTHTYNLFCLLTINLICSM